MIGEVLQSNVHLWVKYIFRKISLFQTQLLILLFWDYSAILGRILQFYSFVQIFC
jgi:hypothetical protein